jgi:hypothetical protein
MIQPSGPTNSSALAMNATGRLNADASSTGSMLLRWFEARITGPRSGTCSPPSTLIRNHIRIKGLTTIPAMMKPRSGCFFSVGCCGGPAPLAASLAGARGASR